MLSLGGAERKGGMEVRTRSVSVQLICLNVQQAFPALHVVEDF